MADKDHRNMLREIAAVMVAAALTACASGYISVQVMTAEVRGLQLRTEALENTADANKDRLDRIADDVAYIRGRLEPRP